MATSRIFRCLEALNKCHTIHGGVQEAEHHGADVSVNVVNGNLLNLASVSGSRIALRFAEQVSQAFSEPEFEQLLEFLEKEETNGEIMMNQSNGNIEDHLQEFYQEEIQISNAPSDRLTGPGGPIHAELGIILHCQSEDDTINNFWNPQSATIAMLQEKGIDGSFCFGFDWHWRAQTSFSTRPGCPATKWGKSLTKLHDKFSTKVLGLLPLPFVITASRCARLGIQSTFGKEARPLAITLGPQCDNIQLDFDFREGRLHRIIIHVHHPAAGFFTSRKKRPFAAIQTDASMSLMLWLLGKPYDPVAFLKRYSARPLRYAWNAPLQEMWAYRKQEIEEDRILSIQEYVPTFLSWAGRYLGQDPKHVIQRGESLVRQISDDIRAKISNSVKTRNAKRKQTYESKRNDKQLPKQKTTQKVQTTNQGGRNFVPQADRLDSMNDTQFQSPIKLHSSLNDPIVITDTVTDDANDDNMQKSIEDPNPTISPTKKGGQLPKQKTPKKLQKTNRGGRKVVSQADHLGSMNDTQFQSPVKLHSSINDPIVITDTDTDDADDDNMQKNAEDPNPTISPTEQGGPKHTLGSISAASIPVGPVLAVSSPSTKAKPAADTHKPTPVDLDPGVVDLDKIFDCRPLPSENVREPLIDSVPVVVPDDDLCQDDQVEIQWKIDHPIYKYPPSAKDLNGTLVSLTKSTYLELIEAPEDSPLGFTVSNRQSHMFRDPSEPLRIRFSSTEIQIYDGEKVLFSKSYETLLSCATAVPWFVQLIHELRTITKTRSRFGSDHVRPLRIEAARTGQHDNGQLKRKLLEGSLFDINEQRKKGTGELFGQRLAFRGVQIGISKMADPKTVYLQAFLMPEGQNHSHPCVTQGQPDDPANRLGLRVQYQTLTGSTVDYWVRLNGSQNVLKINSLVDFLDEKDIDFTEHQDRRFLNHRTSVGRCTKTAYTNSPTAAGSLASRENDQDKSPRIEEKH